MSQLPEGITQDELDRYAVLDRGIKKLSEEKAGLNAKIKTAFTQFGTFVFGKVVIKLSETNTFDPNLLSDSLPFEQHPEFYSPQIDAEKVAALFPYAQYPDLYTPVVDKAKVPEKVRKDFSTKGQRLVVDVTD